MKQQFLQHDIAAAQTHLSFIEQAWVELPILIARGELDKAETLAKEHLASVREMKRLQQRAKNHQKLAEITSGLKNKGILSEVVQRGF